MNRKVNRGYFQTVNPYIEATTKRIKRSEFEEIIEKPLIFDNGDVMFYIGNNLFCLDGGGDDALDYKELEGEYIEIVIDSVIINKKISNAFNAIKESIAEDNKKYEQLQEVKKTYVMLDNKNGCYKIGVSNNPTYRESTLQSEKPYISLIMTKEDNIEKELHNKFNNKRIRGEWFSLSQEDLNDLLLTYGFSLINN